VQILQLDGAQVEGVQPVGKQVEGVQPEGKPPSGAQVGTQGDPQTSAPQMQTPHKAP
jgi:hypothetical protein